MEDEITDITDQLEDLENQGMHNYLFYTDNLCISLIFLYVIIKNMSSSTSDKKNCVICHSGILAKFLLAHLFVNQF